MSGNCHLCGSRRRIPPGADPLYMHDEFTAAVEDAVDEARAAMMRYAAMNSAHEGYAVLDEEVDELWDHVKVKQGQRDVDAMRKEAIQIAAMAIRFAVDVCKPGA